MRAEAGRRIRYIVGVMIFFVLILAGMFVALAAALFATDFLLGDVSVVLKEWYRRPVWAIAFFITALMIPLGAGCGMLTWLFLFVRTGSVSDEEANAILKRPDYVSFSNSQLGRWYFGIIRRIRQRWHK